MHLRCHLREFRGQRSVKDIAEEAGVNRAIISQLERGVALPLEKWVPGLERAYGRAPHEWYPPDVLLAISRGEGEQ